MTTIEAFILLRTVTLVFSLICFGSLAAFLMRFRMIAPLTWKELRDRAPGQTPWPFAKFLRMQRLLNIVGSPSLYEALGDRLLSFLARIYELSYLPFLAALTALIILKWGFLRDAPV